MSARVVPAQVQLRVGNPGDRHPGGPPRLQVGQRDVAGGTADRLPGVLQLLRLQHVRDLRAGGLAAAHRRVPLRALAEERPAPVEVLVHRGAVRFVQHCQVGVRSGALQEDKERVPQVVSCPDEG